MTDGSGTETRTYDNLDRLQTVARGSSTFSYVHDPASNVTRRTYPDGTVVDYAYDPLDRLASVASGGQTTSYAYDVASNLTQTTLPAVLTLTDPNGNATPQAGDGQTSYGYDRANRLTSIDYADSTPDVTFSYDNVGNRLQMTDGACNRGQVPFVAASVPARARLRRRLTVEAWQPR
jgi:YD repeat-containing protein